jgi:ABC-type nitrate/sulfonate/bicarbonate transport system permease component
MRSERADLGREELEWLRRPMGKYISQWSLPAALLMGLVLLWESAVRALRVPAWLLPAPTDILQAMAMAHSLLVWHSWITFQEVILGFLVSLAVGIGLALAIAYSRLVERTVYPIVIASQTVPIVAIAPLLLIWFGYDIGPKVVVVALICFFPIVVNTVDGLRSIDPDMVHMLLTLGARRRHIFFKVQVPNSLPYLFSGTRVAITVSVIGAVIGEWVGASAGLGYFMVRSASQFLTARVFASLVVLAVMGIALFLMVSLIERMAIPWYYTQKRLRATTGEGL